MHFRPRAVPARNAFAWLREAVALTVRAPLAFVALSLAHSALFLLPDPVGDVAFAGIPLLLGAGGALARAADEGRGPSGVRLSAAAAVRLALTGLIIGFLALLAASALERLGDSSSGPVDWSGPLAAPNPFNEALGIAAHASWFWTLAIGPTLWFGVPLVAIAGLRVRQAAVQAMEAFLLNRFLALVWVVAAGIGGLATLVPVLVVPVTALLSATLYTGYRDVWLGRAENAPRTVVRAVQTSTPNERGLASPAPR